MKKSYEMLTENLDIRKHTSKSLDRQDEILSKHINGDIYLQNTKQRRTKQ